MKFLFNKKSKQIEDLSNKNYKLEKELQSVKQLCSYKKDDYNDFISILEQIQITVNTPMQWKQKITTLDNIIGLTIQDYKNKIIELDIDT